MFYNRNPGKKNELGERFVDKKQVSIKIDWKKQSNQWERLDFINGSLDKLRNGRNNISTISAPSMI